MAFFQLVSASSRGRGVTFVLQGIGINSPSVWKPVQGARDTESLTVVGQALLHPNINCPCPYLARGLLPSAVVRHPSIRRVQHG